MKKNFTVRPKSQVKAATDYALIDKLVKDYEDDYVRGKPLSEIWNEITKKHHDSKLARDVVGELEKTNKKVDYYDEDAERDPNFVNERKDKRDIESGCSAKEKVEASDPDDEEGEAPKRCKKCGRRLNDGGTCPVCDDGVEERFADGVDDEDVEGCNVMSASAFELAGIGTEAESIADDLEEWLNAFLGLPETDGYLSEEDLKILSDAHDILQFAAQALVGSKEIF